MSTAIITVEGLGKKYRLGATRSNNGYTALRDVIAQKAAHPWRALSRKVERKESKVVNGQVPPPRSTASEEFWALRDVSFAMEEGEVLGIVGRNGAGKSTLLKILSRITEPTEGKIRIKGRVASLLEVGTGFHAELTGRENVFLNGAILGMHRSEIKTKFDEIVAFAEIDHFLDTPVKRYSSGMYVRLAFAVAAHLEPDILVVDEVLAVGDAEFQKKCLGKMHDVARGGRTVLFVSHNMGAVKELCTKAVMLQAGHLVASGSVENVVNEYLLSGSNQSGTVRFDNLPVKSRFSKPAFFRSVAVLNQARQITSGVDVQEGFAVELIYEIPEPLRKLEVGIRFATSDGRPILTSLLSESFQEIHENPQQGIRRARISVPGRFLMPGSYLLQNIALFQPHGQVYDSYDDVLTIHVEDTGTIFTKYKNNPGIGIVMRTLDWTCDPIPEVDSQRTA